MIVIAGKWLAMAASCTFLSYAAYGEGVMSPAALPTMYFL